MDATTYTTRRDAIEAEVVAPIEANGTATAAEYDIDAIADEVLACDNGGYALAVDEAEFWASVERHAL